MRPILCLQGHEIDEVNAFDPRAVERDARTFRLE